jgi:hypothetical protein
LRVGSGSRVVIARDEFSRAVVGLLWSVTASSLTLHGLWRRSYPLLVLAGVALAIAMGTYRSMVFIGLAGGLLALLWPASSRIVEPLKRATVLTASFGVSLVALFGTVAYLQHARTMREAVQMSLVVDSRDAYLGLTGFEGDQFVCRLWERPGGSAAFAKRIGTRAGALLDQHSV